jgi:hypothetical protein
MLSTIGWVDGLTASGVIVIGFICGAYFIYKSKKLEAELLLNLGLLVILAGLAFLGVFLDFLMVITTGKNISNEYGLVGLLSYIWIAPLIVLGMRMGSRLLMPDKIKLISLIYFILMILFEIAIFLDPMNSFNFIYPEKTGEALIDYNLVLLSPAGFLMIIFIISLVVFLGFGFLIKAFQTTGNVRKKLLLLSTGVFLYAIFGMFESLTEPGFALIIIRIGYISGPLFMYFGLKE